MSLQNKLLLLILAADILVLSLVFSVSGVFNANVDTSDYVLQIEHFVNPGGATAPTLEFRQFKPLYGYLGSFIAPVIGPYATILSFNVLFFIGLSILFFCVLRLLEFDEIESFVGVLWLVFGYPLLKYGLSLGTDISGWFFSCASIALGLYGFKRDKYTLLVLASLAAVLGMLSKETGVLGLGFVGLYALLHAKRWPWRSLFLRLLALSLPFLLCYGLRAYFLSSEHVAGFFDWYTGIKKDLTGYQTPLYLLGVEASAFNVLILLAVVGLYFAVATRDFFTQKWLSVYVPLFIISLPMLLWPIYIGRILYIQFLFFIPLALYGTRHVLEGSSLEARKKIAFSAAMLPPLLSIVLFIFAKNQSLFDVLRHFLS